jgi:hypothetical protein
VTTGISCPGGSPECQGVMPHTAQCCQACAKHLESGRADPRLLPDWIRRAWTRHPDREAVT